MELSVVIPTYNRPKDMAAILKSILKQTTLPKDVVIVDQSDSSTSMTLINQIEPLFFNKKIQLKYIHLDEKNSSKARNLGFQNTSGQIIFFLDDDVTLSEDYFEKVLEVYRRNLNAIGVQGIIIPCSQEHTHLTTWDPFKIEESTSGAHMVNSVWRIFFLPHTQKDRWAVLPSVADVFPIPLTKIIRSPRMQGCCSYKREILQHFRFDEKLGKWSFLEDFDLSYRIHKAKLGYFYVTPWARLFHKHSDMRLNEKTEKFIETVNRTYIFFKDIEQTILNQIIFVWSMLGSMITTIGRTILAAKSKRMRWKLIYLMESYSYTLKYVRSIKQQDLTFFNKVLDQGNYGQMNLTEENARFLQSRALCT